MGEDADFAVSEEGVGIDPRDECGSARRCRKRAVYHHDRGAPAGNRIEGAQGVRVRKREDVLELLTLRQFVQVRRSSDQYSGH